MSTVLQQLFDQYRLEGVLAMPYTMKDFERDYTHEHLHTLTPEERLQGLGAEERLQGLSAQALQKLKAYLADLDQQDKDDPSKH